MRYRVVEELVVLASPADEQIATLRGFDGWHDELVLQWLNWPAAMLPELQRLGALSPESVRTTDAVTNALSNLDRECGEELRSTGDAYAFTAEGLQHDPRWQNIRDLASVALVAFRELGIPTPKLSDEDFNQPREDAP
jgi:hypothetical protein